MIEIGATINLARTIVFALLAVQITAAHSKIKANSKCVNKGTYLSKPYYECVITGSLTFSTPSQTFGKSSKGNAITCIGKTGQIELCATMKCTENSDFHTTRNMDVYSCVKHIPDDDYDI